MDLDLGFGTCGLDLGFVICAYVPSACSGLWLEVESCMGKDRLHEVSWRVSVVGNLQTGEKMRAV